MPNMPKTHADNKGFSLVELLVAFAIFSIISVVIVGMMASGMRFFRDNSANIGLQYEYQTVMTQMREYVVDCNAGIAFVPGADPDADPSALYIVERVQILPSEVDYDPARTDNYRYRTHVFVYDPSGGDPGRLDYYFAPASGMSDRVPPAVDLSASGAMVSTRVTAFDIDITLETLPGFEHPSGVVRAKANVEAEMGFINLTRSYVAAQNIATRNRVVTADSYSDLWDKIRRFDASEPLPTPGP